MNIIDELIIKQIAERDKIIEQAFLKHFGFTIHDVDIREIKHIKTEGCSIESYCYRGETFLYVRDNSGDIKFEKGDCSVKAVYTMEYKEV